ncbi:hypothetical protein PSPO01_15316 [Paraphaeosphaeria sporulosa]
MAESFESLDDSSSSGAESAAPSHEYPGDLRASGPRFPIVWSRLWHGTRLLDSSRVGYKVKDRAQLIGKRKAASAVNVQSSFSVVWSRLWHGKLLLNSLRVGYKVKGKAQLLGKRKAASIWGFGAELEYVEDDGRKTTLFLCQQCHIEKRSPCCWTYDGIDHIKKYLRKAHNVDADTGLLPVTEALQQQSPWQHAAGSSSSVSHHIWQEEELQMAYMDWRLTDLEPSGVAARAAGKPPHTF